MNQLAKRLYNVTPDAIRLTFDDDATLGGDATLDDDATLTLDMHHAEFFQDELEAEGQSDDGTTYRIVDGDDDTLLVARETTDGWTVVGEATAVDRA